MTILLVTFYVLAAISIYLGVLSLRNGVRFIRYLQAELAKEYSEYEPFVTVFLPLRGVDHDLEKNITALFAQTYANYEVIFVGDDANDPAWGTVEKARRRVTRESGPTMQIVVAGRAADRGQKVHNLNVAIEHADPGSEIFAFVDSDVQVAPHWLAALVAQ